MTRRDLLSQRVRRISVLAGLVAALIGTAGLAAPILELPALATWLAGRGSLFPAAALGLLLLGLGIAAVVPSWRRRWIHRFALVPALATLALGLVGLFEAAAGVDLVLKAPLAEWRGLSTGHMPPLTAVALVLGALALAERQQPHVVFLDLDLPDVDGRTVARRLRERRRPPLLLVAISGFGGERHFDLSREAGIDRHLVKPVDVEEVLELLRSVSVAKAPG